MTVAHRQHARRSAALVAALALTACQADRPPEGMRTVRAEQFRDASAPPAEASEQPPPRVRLLGEERAPQQPIAVLSAQEAAERFELEARDGAADGVVAVRRPGASPRGAEATVLIDAKVGDINGKAIYANQFLTPMSAKLRTEAEVTYADDPAGWLAMARRDIAEGLRRTLEEELVRAEAVASLSDQERRYGLLELSRRMRTHQVRRFRGSQRLFERAIKDQFGEDATLDDYLLHGRNLHLSQMLIDREIDRRVNISWREILQEYERRDDDFRPPPRALFRLIRVRQADVDAVERIASALAADKPFEHVASLPANGYRHESGGLYEATIQDELDSARVFRLENLNEAAVSLRPGEVAGPIEDEPYVSWVRLERIEVDQIPLYDAQLAIERQRETEQRRIEMQRFVDRLKQRASFTGLDEMTNSLLRIAADRYNPDAAALLRSRR